MADQGLLDAYVSLMMRTGMLDRVADPVNPQRNVKDAKAVAAGAVDPMGLTSGLIGHYSPEAAQALIAAQEENPIASSAGAIATGSGALSLAGRVAKPLAAAAAGLVGMTGSAKPAGDNPEFEELRRSLVKETPEIARLRQQVDDANAAVKQSAGLEGQAAGSKQMAARASSTANARSALDTAEERLARAMAGLQSEASRRAEGIMMGRAEGSKARKQVLDSQPKPFFQQYEAARSDLPFLPSGSMLPVVAGALGGLAVAGKALPSAWAGRVGASKALEAGDDALARELVKQHAPKLIDPKVAGTGIVAGGTAGGIPVGADAYSLPEMNPEKEAGRRAVEALLDIDPRKEGERSRVEALPDKNPAKEVAQDWRTYAKSMGFGAIEGMGGAKMTSMIVDALRPDFKNVKATLAARGSASTPPGGGNNGPGGPPPNAPRSYDPYRDEVRNRYRTDIADHDATPNPSDFNRAAQLSYGSGNPAIPSIVRRTEATNKAVEDFVAKHGRMPKTSADYAQIFKKTGTLGIAGAVGASAGGDDEETDPTTARIVQMLSRQ
jgi:hypothetical protein